MKFQTDDPAGEFVRVIADVDFSLPAVVCFSRPARKTITGTTASEDSVRRGNNLALREDAESDGQADFLHIS